MEISYEIKRLRDQIAANQKRLARGIPDRGHRRNIEWQIECAERRIAEIVAEAEKDPAQRPETRIEPKRAVPRGFRPPARRPALLVDRNGLTRRDRAVLKAILEFADGAPKVQISNQDLAYATGYKRRSIQLATAALHDAGLAYKRYIKVKPTHNLPNEYVIPENAAEALPGAARRAPSSRPTTRAAQGCKKSMQMTPRSTPQDHTSKHNSRSVGCNPWQGRARGSGERPPSPARPLPRAAPPVAADPGDVDILKRAIKRVGGPDLTTAAVEPAGFVYPAIRDLLSEVAPDYPEGLWCAYLRRHGITAYFAAIETVASHRGFIPRPDGRGPLRNPGGYLSGILRKPPEDCHPASTVATWLAIDERSEEPPRIRRYGRRRNPVDLR